MSRRTAASAPVRTRRRSQVANAAVLNQLTSEILELKGRTGKALYQMGLRLARIRDEELWRLGRYEGFDDYVERALDVSRSTAYKLVRVAREFNAAIARRYGVEKLNLGLRYLDMTPVDEKPGDLLAADIQWRDRHGRYVSVPFHEASVLQIRSAIQLLQEARQAKRRPSPELRKRAERLEQKLPPPPAGVSAGSRIRLRRARDGRVAITFAAIPVDELDQFIEAVRTYLLE